MADRIKRTRRDQFSSEDVLVEALKRTSFFSLLVERVHQRKDSPQCFAGGTELFRESEMSEFDDFFDLLPIDHTSNWLTGVLNRYIWVDLGMNGYQIEVSRSDENDIAYLNDLIYKISFLERGDIPKRPTAIEQILTRCEELKDKPVIEQERALEALEKALSKTWVERVKPVPTADVMWPKGEIEIWEGSEEQRKADAKEMNRDDAVISFTARVYSGYLPGQQPVGIAITDFKDKGVDEPLYDEWVALKNRRAGRTYNTEWPEGAPFASRNARNDFILEKLQTGELLPPSNQKVYHSLKGALWSRFGVNLDDYLSGDHPSQTKSGKSGRD